MSKPTTKRFVQQLYELARELDKLEKAEKQ
jgi:hypothetical protein